MDLVIFDCDGTLVDSEFLCNLAMQQQLAELDIEASAEQLVAEYRGVKLNVIMSSLEAVFSTTFPDNFEVEYRKKVAQLFDLHLTPNQGVIELIESLSIPYCIASSAPMKSALGSLTQVYFYMQQKPCRLTPLIVMWLKIV